MTFNSQPPTVPGFYAWKYCEDDDGKSVIFISKEEINGTGEEIPQGSFSRLVPVEEVEKAYKEGWKDALEPTIYSVDMEADWNLSRAKQIVDGTKRKEGGE